MSAGMPSSAKVDVVALVASAGGLDALSDVLRDLPTDFPVPVVVQQHLGGGASVLTTILARRSHRDVGWAQDGSVLTPGQVAVCPARMQLQVSPDGTCSVTPLAPSRIHPHDVLLTSLAESFGPRALAVVLSGSGSDGAAGTTALKNAGGTVIAQSEDTSEYPSMPQAAIAAGADLVLPLWEIGRVINGVAHGEPLR
jgi:two-component system, chemotaxis family, protein-glutamate methylesterase/glutaminase